ncbi:hypothetical protein VI01_09320 [Pantoea sp. SM3]|nr:hypothetical protein VI01_09320 [Pantoea sp. SM3]
MSAIDDINYIINGIFHGIRPALNRRYSKYHVTVSANAMVSTTRCSAVLMRSMPAFGQNSSLDPNLQILKYVPEEHLVIEIVNKTAAARNRSLHMGE